MDAVKDRIVIGKYLSHDMIKTMIKISLYPIDLVSYWSRCGLTADFGATFLSYCLINQRMSKNSLSVVLNELIENAVKFSAEKSSIIKVLLFEKMDNIIAFEVRNTVDTPHFEKLLAFSRELEECDDLEKKYMETVSKLKGIDDRSGLGLITVIKDFNAHLSFAFNKLPNGLHEVCIQSLIDIEEIRT